MANLSEAAQFVHRNSPPIINEIFAVSFATAAAMARLALGTGAVNLSLESQLINYRAAADRFWKGDV